MRSTTVFLPLVLAGCAAALVPGTSREPDVIARFGNPAEQWQLPDGSRVLEYPRQPLGYENWRVVLAPDGTVRAVQQLLDEVHFARLRPGMTMDEVKREIGPYAEMMHFRNLAETTWSWRYMEPGSRRVFFNAHFDSAGRLKYTSRTDEYVPEPDNADTHN